MNTARVAVVADGFVASIVDTAAPLSHPPVGDFANLVFQYIPMCCNQGSTGQPAADLYLLAGLWVDFVIGSVVRFLRDFVLLTPDLEGAALHSVDYYRARGLGQAG